MRQVIEVVWGRTRDTKNNLTKTPRISVLVASFCPNLGFSFQLWHGTRVSFSTIFVLWNSGLTGNVFHDWWDLFATIRSSHSWGRHLHRWHLLLSLFLIGSYSSAYRFTGKSSAVNGWVKSIVASPPIDSNVIANLLWTPNVEGHKRPLQTIRGMQTSGVRIANCKQYVNGKCWASESPIINNVWTTNVLRQKRQLQTISEMHTSGRSASCKHTVSHKRCATAPPIANILSTTTYL